MRDDDESGNEWMLQHARNAWMHFADQPTPAKRLIMDMGSKFSVGFRQTLRSTASR